MSPRTRGFYERRVFPWINDTFAGRPEFDALRREVVQDARGRAVEIGFGTGASLRHYPPTVESVVAIEPNIGMVERARRQVSPPGDRRVPLHFVEAAAERMPLADGTADTVVCVLTLCSVSDPARVLAEVRRVLAPDGQLLFMEHGLAEDPAVARWQRRLNPIQQWIACGCHLDRAVAPTIEAAGFVFDAVRSFHLMGAPRIHGWLTVGRARPGRRPDGAIM